MPEAADRAFHALSSRARTMVLRALTRDADRSRPQIAKTTGLTTEAVRVSLNELERLGYVTVSHPPGLRHGRRVTYSANADTFRNDLAVLAAYIHG